MKTIHIDQIRTDSDTQARIEIDQETVADYAELLETHSEWPFDPVVVFSDGTDTHLADGFHRTLAASRVGITDIPVESHPGTAFDARLYGMTANDKHGLRMRPADRRKSIEYLLDKTDWTQKKIAVASGVSERTVRRIVAEQKDAEKTKREQSEPKPTIPQSVTKTHTNQPDKPDNVLLPETENGNSGKSDRPEKEEIVDQVSEQRTRTIRAVEAAMREFDDLQSLHSNVYHNDVIDQCKMLLSIAEEWCK